MVPWKNGKPLIWDTTCPDTLALSYRLLATSSAGAVAGMAEEKKVRKYSCLAPTHTIMPVAVETLGAVGPRSLAFLKELAARMKQQSGEERAFQYLMQQLSVAMQRGNSVAVGGTVGGPPSIRHFCVV